MEKCSYRHVRLVLYTYMATTPVQPISGRHPVRSRAITLKKIMEIELPEGSQKFLVPRIPTGPYPDGQIRLYVRYWKNPPTGSSPQSNAPRAGPCALREFCTHRAQILALVCKIHVNLQVSL